MSDLYTDEQSQSAIEESNETNWHNRQLQFAIKESNGTTLDISTWPLNKDSYCEIFNDLLKDNKTFADIILNKCELKDISPIKNVLKGASIEGISLKKNHLDIDCVEHINDILDNTTTLKRLNLMYNELSCDDFCSILKQVENHPSLCELHIGHDNVRTHWQFGTDVQQYQAIQKFLQNNKKITYLSIFIVGSNDSLTVIYFTNGLQTNTTLKRLDLSNNEFTEDALELFVKMLKTNATLLELNFNDISGVTDYVIQLFIDVLQHNNIIQKITFEKCEKLDVILLDELNEKLAHNCGGRIK